VVGATTRLRGEVTTCAELQRVFAGYHSGRAR